MDEQKTKTKEIVAVVSAPLAIGATTLLLALVSLEYFRRGFVSNFFDLRYIVALVIVFWTANILTAAQNKNGAFQKIVALIILIFALYVIISLSLPFGRLGLVVIATGILTAVAMLVSVLKT